MLFQGKNNPISGSDCSIFPLRKTRKTLRLNPVPKICNLRLVWQNIQILSPNSDPKDCVSFDHEPALTCHGRDRLREDHWRPLKTMSKIDDYLRLFSLNNHDSWLFPNDGETIQNKVFSQEYGVEILFGFLGSVKIPSEFFELAWKLRG